MIKQRIIYSFFPIFFGLCSTNLRLSAQQNLDVTKVIDSSFLIYMKEVQNPYRYGLTKEVFYPYSTRYGQRIGWGMEIKNKEHYKKGQTQQQADSILNLELRIVAVSLNKFLKKNYPEYLKEEPELEVQQILLDRAFTEGIDHLSVDFCKAVLEKDWDKLIRGYLYIRQPEGWPDIIKNVAFAQRWIYGKTGKPLIKL